MKIYKPSGRCNASGEQVRSCREAAGLSQEQLAAKLQLAGLNLGQKAISRIETGERIVRSRRDNLPSTRKRMKQRGVLPCCFFCYATILQFSHLTL